MGDMLPAIVTTAVGVVLLVLALVPPLRRVRRFARARSALRSSLGERLDSLRALWSARRRGSG
jgi:hypothetical protein